MLNWIGMKRIILRTCCIWLILSVGSGRVVAQEFKGTKEMQQRFIQAKDLLLNFKNDSSLLILNELSEELVNSNRIDSPFGIRVQLRQAEALEKDHKNEKALEKLLHLSDVCEKRKYWDVLTNNQLSLAHLYEKIGLKDNCLMSLRYAESIIKTHEIDSLYPRFSIRISSYHRIFNDGDSTLFYAKEVLRTAPKYGKYEEEAVGHILAAMMLVEEDKEQAIEHFNAAGHYWKKTGDYSGYGGVMGNLTSIYSLMGDLEKALIYNDSSLIAADLAAKMGVDAKHLYYYTYKKRGELFNELGNTDSAWLYINKGFEMQLSEVYKSNTEKLLEIDARYKDKKKEQKIQEQKQEIRYERERRNWLWGMSGLLLLFTSLLGYAYLRLRKVNRKTEKQAAIISESNTDLSISLKRQKVLQSEVHHRVKNNLQVIISLLELHLDEVETPKARKSLEDMANRVYSMASMHGLLYQDGDTDLVNIHNYTSNLCEHFSNLSPIEKKPVFDLDIEALSINLETLMPVGIMLTELLTNSFQHGYIGEEQLHIYIKINTKKDGYFIFYKDNGPGFTENNIDGKEEGLGNYLLKSMSRQLEGTYTNYNDEGAITEIFFKEKNH